MGLGLDDLDEEQLVDHIFKYLAGGAGGWMVNPNVDVLRQVAADASVRGLVSGADLVVADGMPLLWASRLQGSPLRARVPVSEAIFALCARAAREGVAVLLLGGAPGTAARAGALLAGRSPGLVVNYLSPPIGFEDDQEEMSKIFNAVERDAPRGLVFCAFGFPKQERLMALLHNRFPSCWLIGSGGTFTIIAGETPKAPEWMRKSGLEWAHRFRLEPRRLWRRYFVDDAPFALRLLGSSALARARHRHEVPNHLLKEERA
ncbi:MAG TPA: WecB/TagA/CpsF family glycosyltransferase [Acidimicrobiales bacterium]|nr:WecB/TagA/CpsF family glycosyltransferase [Acidimicrobiales bacterium]